MRILKLYNCGYGEVESLPYLDIIVQPQDMVIEVNKDAEFTVDISTNIPSNQISYRWYVDGAEQTDSNSKTFIYKPTEIKEYSVQCFITSGATTIQSREAKLTTIEETYFTITRDLPGTSSTKILDGYTSYVIAETNADIESVKANWYIDGVLYTTDVSVNKQSDIRIEFDCIFHNMTPSTITVEVEFIIQTAGNNLVVQSNQCELTFKDEESDVKI